MQLGVAVLFHLRLEHVLAGCALRDECGDLLDDFVESLPCLRGCGAILEFPDPREARDFSVGHCRRNVRELRHRAVEVEHERGLVAERLAELAARFPEVLHDRNGDGLDHLRALAFIFGHHRAAIFLVPTPQGSGSLLDEVRKFPGRRGVRAAVEQHERGRGEQARKAERLAAVDRRLACAAE